MSNDPIHPASGDPADPDLRTRTVMLRAARLLRSAMPESKDLELYLHDIARMLEMLATAPLEDHDPDRDHLIVRMHRCLLTFFDRR